MRETWVWFLGQEDPLEKGMATHSSTLAWRIPWREQPGRLQSMGSLRVGHDWATSLHFTSLHFTSLLKMESYSVHFCVWSLWLHCVVFFCVFWPHQVACVISGPQPGRESVPLQQKCVVLTTGPPESLSLAQHLPVTFIHLLHGLVFHSFVLLSSMQLHGHTNLCIQSMDIWEFFYFGAIVSKAAMN